MNQYPVIKITLPSDLQNVENGKVPSSLIRKGAAGAYMHHRATIAWNAMCKAAAAEGVHLAHVGDYRSYDRQEALFLDRYVPRRTLRKPPVTRKWQGKVWWLKVGKSPSGTPGTSNHGLGLAIDAAVLIKGKVQNITAALPKGTKYKTALQWLEQNAVRFGFCWEVADPKNPNFEAWHLIYYPGDKIPDAVAA